MKNINFILLILILFSCEREILSRKTIFTLTCLDETTGLPIKDISVSLSGHAQGGFGRYNVKLGYSKSDAKGVATIKFKPLKNSLSFDFYVSKENYFDPYTPNLKPNEIGLAQKIYLKPKAKLKLNYKNVKPFDEKDYMWAFFDNLKDIGFIYPKNTTGKNIDGTETFEVNGNKLIEFDIRVTKNGKLSRYKESTFIKPFVLNEYTINY